MERYQAIEVREGTGVYIAVVIKKNGEAIMIGEGDQKCLLFNNKEEAIKVAKETFEKFINKYPEER